MVKKFIKNKKFKSEIIKFQFQDELAKVNLAARFVLSRMMENYSKKYQTKQEISRKLEELYGASFYVRSSNIGRLNLLSFSIVFPIEKFSQKKIATEASDFLTQQIFQQKLTEDNFKIEKENSLNSASAMYEDKMYLAFQMAKKNYFKDKDIASSEIGTIEEIKKVTFNDVQKEYKKLIKSNIQIIQVGSKALKFDAYKFKFSNYIYQQKEQNFKNKTIKLPVEQTKIVEVLTLGKLKKNEYFSSIALNDLLGGQTSSLLFSIIREQLGLAYDVSSSLDFTTGTLYVLAGIEKKNIDLFHKTLLEIIGKIKNKEISSNLFTEIKQNIKTNLLRKQDQLNNVANRELLSKTLEIDLSFENSLKQLDDLKIDDIAEVANKIKPQLKLVLQNKND